MKLKIVFLIGLLISSAAFVSAQDKAKTDKIEQELRANEKLAWKLLVDKKYDEFGKSLAADYRGVYSFGVLLKESEMGILKTTNFKSAEVTDTKLN